MKKFVMTMPRKEKCEKYEIVTAGELHEGKTRFPLMALINSYVERGEEIRVVAVTPDTDSRRIHEQQLRDELASLQEEKGFVCRRGVEAIPITYAGDVDTQLELFRKLLPVFEAGDTLYACLTYGNKAMSIAELMAIQYAYRIIDDVTIGRIIYGALDHSAYPPRIQVCDITALIRLDEIVRLLAGRRTADPASIIKHILAFCEGEV